MDVLDWGGIKATAIALKSVNAAASKVGSHLPPHEQNRLRERINKRACRERWMDTAEALAITAPTNAMPLSKPVQTGSQALQSHLDQDNQRTRIGFSTAARKAAEHLGKLIPTVLMDKDIAQSAKHWTGVAGTVHGWETKGKTDPGMVNITLVKLDLTPVTEKHIEAQVLSPDSGVSE